MVLTGSVLTPDVGRTFCAELDAGEEVPCEGSRVNVSASDPAASDTRTDGQYFFVQFLKCVSGVMQLLC